jgi:hypothetical protein
LPHRKVIALDSDGTSVVAVQSGNAGNWQPKNLVVYVFDNGVYSGSRISYPTRLSGNRTWPPWLREPASRTPDASGFRNFKKHGLDALARNELSFLVCKVEKACCTREIPVPTPTWRKQVHIRALPRTDRRAGDAVRGPAVSKNLFEDSMRKFAVGASGLLGAICSFQLTDR